MFLLPITTFRGASYYTQYDNVWYHYEDEISQLTQIRFGKLQQTTCGDNYKVFYLVALFDRLSITSSHRDWGCGLWVAV